MYDDSESDDEEFQISEQESEDTGSEESEPEEEEEAGSEPNDLQDEVAGLFEEAEEVGGYNSLGGLRSGETRKPVIVEPKIPKSGSSSGIKRTPEEIEALRPKKTKPTEESSQKVA